MRSLLVFVLTAAAAAPGLTERAGQGLGPPLAGSARISGRVQAIDNGAAVRGAHVRLSGTAVGAQETGSTPARVEREAESDDNGSFTFADLPDGSYSVSVQPPNRFLALEQPVRVSVEAGHARQLQIRLARTGAITGRITDRNGEGVQGMQVHALRRNDFRGHVTLTPAHSSRASSDDRGQFRLFNLPAGEYYVVATPVRAPRPLAGSGRPGLVTTYYPGTAVRAGARLVVVRSGKDTARVNFSAVSARLYTVAVEAVDSRGAALGHEASATLNTIADEHLPMSMRQASRQPDGRWTFSDVPAGDYYLVVSGSPRREEAAYVTVSIDRDVTLNVRTNPGARVAGRIVVEGQPEDSPPAPPPSSVVVTATRPPWKMGPSYTEPLSVHPQGTGQFELIGLRGPMMLHAQMSGALLASISRAGGQDLAGKLMEFTGTEDIDDLVVVFTRAKAQVEVTLTGLREPEDPESVLVMLFSEDPARRHAGSMQYTSIQASHEMPGDRRSGRSFTFQLGPVVPGRYLLAAVPSPGYAYPTDEAVLQRLREVAMPVTLVDGKTERVVVRVSR